MATTVVVRTIDRTRCVMVVSWTRRHQVVACRRPRAPHDRDLTPSAGSRRSRRRRFSRGQVSARVRAGAGAPARRSGRSGRGRRGRAPAGRCARRRPRRRWRGVSSTSAGDPAAPFWREVVVEPAADGGGPALDLGRRSRRSTPPARPSRRGRRGRGRWPRRRRRTWRPGRRTPPTGANGRLNSLAKRAARRGVRLGPHPPMMIGGPPGCTGLGSAGEPTTV